MTDREKKFEGFLDESDELNMTLSETEPNMGAQTEKEEMPDLAEEINKEQEEFKKFEKMYGELLTEAKNYCEQCLKWSANNEEDVKYFEESLDQILLSIKNSKNIKKTENNEFDKIIEKWSAYVEYLKIKLEEFKEEERNKSGKNGSLKKSEGQKGGLDEEDFNKLKRDREKDDNSKEGDEIPTMPIESLVRREAKEKNEEKESKVPKMRNLWEVLQTIKQENKDNKDEWQKEWRKIFGKLAGERTYRFVEVNGQKEMQYMKLKLDGQTINESSKLTFEVYDKNGQKIGEESKEINKIKYADFKKVEEDNMPKKGEKVLILNDNGIRAEKNVTEIDENNCKFGNMPLLPIDQLRVYENDGKTIYTRQRPKISEAQERYKKEWGKLNTEELMTPEDLLETETEEEKKEWGKLNTEESIMAELAEKNIETRAEQVRTKEVVNADLVSNDEEIKNTKNELKDLYNVHSNMVSDGSLRGIINAFESSGRLFLRGITGGKLGKDPYTEEEFARVGERFDSLKNKTEILYSQKRKLLEEKSKLGKKWWQFLVD